MPADGGRRIAVVGAGWAGLAAAIEATRAGHHVTVFEMAGQSGGRARRVDMPGWALDNGQHILIGAYTETLRLMRTVGVDLDHGLVRSPLSLLDADGNGLRLPPGPPMLAFARGVMQHRGWRRRERLALLAVAARWWAGGFACGEALTVQQLTARLPSRLRRELIEPLCVAALNTPADAASAQVFLTVLRDALFAGAGSADLLLPRVPLSELLPMPAEAWLRAAGAHVVASHRVQSISREAPHEASHDAAGWRVDGEPFDHVVLACSAVEAARLAQPYAPGWSAVTAALRYEPIVTLYAHAPGTRLPHALLRLDDDVTRRPAQFVFDLGQLGGREGLLALVISGAAPWVARGHEATVQAALAQAGEALAKHLKSPLREVRTLVEKRATFRCTPGLVRPAAFIAPGLGAAGDYVAGPYPATLEGAVRSGVAAARRLQATG